MIYMNLWSRQNQFFDFMRPAGSGYTYTPNLPCRFPGLLIGGTPNTGELPLFNF
jgi:hypothetical protein